MEEHNPHDDPEKAKARKDQADPWVMYLIVRESLGMSAGKIGAQCGHAVGMMYEKYRKLDAGMFENDDVIKFDSWADESFRKVVLRADDKEWIKLKAEIECFVVRDAGFTEVPAGSETVIGLWPMKKSLAPKIVKKLQVLK